jgi:hypothetical protein
MTLGADLLRPRLELRPISMNFANGLPASLLSDLSASPPPPMPNMDSRRGSESESDKLVAEAIKEQIANARKGWMVQLFELEAQVRELKDELEEARRIRPGQCEACGCTCAEQGRIGHTAQNGMGSGQALRGSRSGEFLKPSAGVMDRGRAKTGGARGVFGSGSLYEWE